MATNRHDIRECFDAREYCDAFMARYIVLLDNVIYMPSEHVQKEKEYGITWRSAFKKELNCLVDALYIGLDEPEGANENMDPFTVLHELVKKDCIDAATFDMKTQADSLSNMLPKLHALETAIF